MLIIKEVISPPTNEDLIDDFDRMSPKSQSKYSIQAMAASPYIRQFKNPSLSVGALSKYFSKDQVKQLQSNQSKYNFQMKKWMTYTQNIYKYIVNFMLLCNNYFWNIIFEW